MMILAMERLAGKTQVSKNKGVLKPTHLGS